MSVGSAGIALLGCAHIHVPHYLRAIAARSDARLIAVADDDPVLAASTAHVADSAVRSVADILADPAVGAVMVVRRPPGMAP
jgi:predicted dehydrogenase